jgi:hypothetical protein
MRPGASIAAALAFLGRRVILERKGGYCTRSTSSAAEEKGQSMGRRIAIALLGASLLVIGLSLPASAQQVPVSFSGPVTAGQSLTLECPEGHQVDLVEGSAPNASANFYRNANRKSAVVMYAPPTSMTRTSVMWIVPKGAKSADAILYCIPNPTQVFFGGTITDTTPFSVTCPAGTPYFYGTNGAEAHNPETGERVNITYSYVFDSAGNRIGITIHPPEERIGWEWSADLFCTATAQ